MGSYTIHLFFTFIFIAYGYAQVPNPNAIDVDDIKKTIQDSPTLNDVQKQLDESGINLPNITNTNIDPEKVEKVLKDKCESRNATDAVERVKGQQDIIRDCVTLYLNGSEIEAELQEAKKTGSMDEVFTKYCKKWPDVYKCFDNATATLRTCLTEEEDKSFNKTLDIVQEMQEFMCHKDGDRLALFVAEGGVECLKEKQEAISGCFNTTYGGRIPDTNDLSASSLPIVLFLSKDCEDFEILRNCIKGQLETCKDTTPANILDATFKFIKKQMVCDEAENSNKSVLKADANTYGAGFRSVGSSVLIVLTLVALFRL